MLMGVFLYSSQRMDGPDSWRERVCMCVAHLRAEARLTDTERRRAVKKKTSGKTSPGSLYGRRAKGQLHRRGACIAFLFVLLGKGAKKNGEGLLAS